MSDIAIVRRGVATGANDFFVKPREEFRALGIPEQFLKPILPSSRYLKSDVIESNSDGYPNLLEPLALLDCPVDAREVERSFPKLFQYLNSESGLAARQGYLTSGRRPWYSQEQRQHAPVLVTYMSRARNGANPFRIFWNKSRATATNVFLLLIPKAPLAQLLADSPEKAGLLRDFLASKQPSQFIDQGRVYGGGLHKMEPKELGRIDVTGLVADLGLSVGQPAHEPQLRMLL